MRFSTDILQLALPDRDRFGDLKDDLFDRLTIKEGFALASTALRLFVPQVEKDYPEKMVFVDDILLALELYIEGTGDIDLLRDATVELGGALDGSEGSRITAFLLGGVQQSYLTADALGVIWAAFHSYPQDVGKYLEWWVTCLKRWGPLYDEALYQEKISGLMRRYQAGEGTRGLLQLNNDDLYRLYIVFCKTFIESPIVSAENEPLYKEILKKAVVPALLGSGAANQELWSVEYQLLGADDYLGRNVLEPPELAYLSGLPLVLLARIRSYLDQTFYIEQLGKVAGFRTKVEAQMWLIDTAMKIVEGVYKEPAAAQVDPFNVPILTVDDILGDFRAKEYMGTQYGGDSSAHTVCVSPFDFQNATDEGNLIKDRAEVYPIAAFAPLDLDNRSALVFELNGGPLYSGPLLFKSYSYTEDVSPGDPFRSQHGCFATNPGSAARTSLTGNDSLSLSQLVKVLEQLPRETELFVRGPEFLAPIIGVCDYIDDSRVIFRSWGGPTPGL